MLLGLRYVEDNPTVQISLTSHETIAESSETETIIDDIVAAPTVTVLEDKPLKRKRKDSSSGKRSTKKVSVNVPTTHRNKEKDEAEVPVDVSNVTHEKIALEAPIPKDKKSVKVASTKKQPIQATVAIPETPSKKVSFGPDKIKVESAI